MFCLPENLKIVRGIEPKTDAAGTTGDYVNLKNYQMAWVIWFITQGNAATIACSISKATGVLPAGATAMTATVPIWTNEDLATSDLLVRQTDAASFTTSAATTHKMVVMQIDPIVLGPTYDCIAAVTGASDVANLVSALYYLEPRYAADQPPTAITD